MMVFQKNKHLLTSLQLNLLFLIVLFTACDSRKIIKGNEIMVTDQRELPAFNAIDIQGNYEVKLLKNENSAFKIEADENIISHIVADIEGDTLRIFNREKIKSNQNIKIFINYWDLNSITCGGTSSIKSETPIQTENLLLNMIGTGFIDLELIAQTLELNLSGTGLINLSGKVDKENLNISGAGKLNSFNLISKNCYIKLSCIGIARIHVEDHLNAQLSGVGGIKYKGKPLSVNREIVGIGIIDEDND